MDQPLRMDADMKNAAAPAAKWDVVTLGNAIMDLVADVEEGVLARHGFEHGRMILGDRAAAVAVTSDLDGAEQCAGGSAANTAVGVAALGGQAAFLGRYADDPMGRAFRDSMEAAGVACPLGYGPPEPPTGRAIVLVTPDHERSMMAFPGAGATLTGEDLDPADAAGGDVLFIEGYLFYDDRTARAAATAAAHATAGGRTVALSLSDPNCVEVNRGPLLDLVRSSVSLLFSNEEEITGLYRTDDFAAAADRAADDVRTAFLTRGAAGAVVVHDGRRETVPAAAVPGGVQDLTGAGDLFAAGALFGLSRALAPERAARIGAACAAEVISHHGARPHADLGRLVREAGLY